MAKNCFRQNKDIVLRQEEDEVLLFNPDSSEIVVINSTGRFIWELCDGKNTREDIVNKLTDEFDVPKEKAGKDLEDFLLSLDKGNFLQK